MKIKTYIPYFSGFYNSVHDFIPKESWLNYAKLYVQELTCYPLEVEAIISPREYNFETDKILATIDESILLESLNNQTILDEFSSLAEERLKHVSGFIPLFPNEPMSWGKVSTWNPAQVSLLLEAMIYVEHDEVVPLEDYLLDNIIDSTEWEEYPNEEDEE